MISVTDLTLRPWSIISVIQAESSSNNHGRSQIRVPWHSGIQGVVFFPPGKGGGTVLDRHRGGPKKWQVFEVEQVND